MGKKFTGKLKTAFLAHLLLLKKGIGIDEIVFLLNKEMRLKY
jgi:hypothetical protein